MQTAITIVVGVIIVVGIIYAVFGRRDKSFESGSGGSSRPDSESPRDQKPQ